MNIPNNHCVIHKPTTDLEVDFNTINEKEHNHNEEQERIASIKHMRKKASIFLILGLLGEEDFSQKKRVGNDIEDEEPHKRLAKEPWTLTSYILKVECLCPEANNK